MYRIGSLCILFLCDFHLCLHKRTPEKMEDLPTCLDLGEAGVAAGLLEQVEILPEGAGVP
jgi:hypothetical protein